MPKLAKTVAVLFTLLTISSIVTGGELPVLRDIQVSNKVVVDSNTGIYTYNYFIINSASSTGSVQRIEIDITKPMNTADLDRNGLTNGAGYLKSSSEHIITTNEIALVPVGFPLLPTGWLAGITIEGMAKWGSRSSYQVVPGQKFEGFTLCSKGLPTIRAFKITPKIDKEALYPNVDEIGDESKIAQIIDQMKQDEENAKYKGKTIGPTAPPADFKPVDFLNSIINMKHEAHKLGWIKNEGIVKSLDAKLENAKKDIEKGNTRSAKNILKAFINEVEAQGCESYENCPSEKHLTSEAYGLLKYNALYLIDHL